MFNGLKVSTNCFNCVCLKKILLRDHFSKAKNKPLTYQEEHQAVVCGGKICRKGRLRSVPLLPSVTDATQCVSRNPVLLELELLVSAGEHRKVGLNLSESLKVPRCRPKEDRAQYWCWSGSSHQMLRWGWGWWLLLLQGCSRWQQHVQGALQAIALTAHSHEQAWMSLMAAGLDKAICLVCSVNAITWFKRHHKLNGTSSSHSYWLLGAAGLPGQQQKLSYWTPVMCIIPIPASQAGWWKPW